MKRILALALVVLMLFSLAACGEKNNDEDNLLGMSASPLAAPEIVKDYTIADDFKIGFICLHDKKSTYDLNFLNAVDTVKQALGLKDEQVIVKVNVSETDACYTAAADLVDQGCDVVFANSFGHEDFILKAAKEFPDVEFCHATPPARRLTPQALPTSITLSLPSMKAVIWRVSLPV